MKHIKFAPHLVKPILSGEKTVTWRLFDDKDLSVGDVVVFVNSETREEFATARVLSVKEKSLGSVTTDDYVGHESYASTTEMIEIFRGYYGDAVDEQTHVKIIGFKLLIRVVGCVIRQDTSLLLLHRTKRGWWETPGGKVEEGESDYEAVAREAAEEIGCRVEVGEKLCEDVFEVDGYDMHATWYTCWLKGEPQIGEPERFDKMEFIPIEHIRDRNPSPAVRILMNYLSRI